MDAGHTPRRPAGPGAPHHPGGPGRRLGAVSASPGAPSASPAAGGALPAGAAVRGVVRLLNTADGRALCLAGAVDAAAVADFLARYGREPARVDVVDARSVTSLCGAALELVRDHLDVAALGGRTVAVRRGAAVDRLLGGTAARVPRA